VREGEFVAIEGRSGSGKSTLLHIFAGLDAPDSGGVEFGSTNIGALAQSSVRWRRRFEKYLGVVRILRLTWLVGWIRLLFVVTDRADRQLARIRNTQFGFVFQFYYLLPELNVLENTLLSLMVHHSWFGFRAERRALRERATEVLKSLGMDHRLKHRPNQLSGGERQRVAIARALMNNPRVLFADEPTGNLDADTGRQIMSVLEKLHRDSGQTIIMVTHDRTLARQADRVLVLRDGRLEKAES
jgi:lipoprotein-releasing system ATP-binding protein